MYLNIFVKKYVNICIFSILKVHLLIIIFKRITAKQGSLICDAFELYWKGKVTSNVMLIIYFTVISISYFFLKLTKVKSYKMKNRQGI